MNKFLQIVVPLMFVIAACAQAQHANDTLLFTIQLDGDSTGIRCCKWGEPVRATLSGPVLMKDNTFLFYSCNGYELYDEKGKCIDSYSLIRRNRSNIRNGSPLLKLAYPLDSNTIVFRTEQPGVSASAVPQQIFHKSLSNRNLKPVKPDAAESISGCDGTSQLFNLYHNGITDEMAVKCQIKPFLVGYSSVTGGKKWWALDNFYSFTSPLIAEENGRYLSFFYGFRGAQDKSIKKTLAEPLGVFTMNGVWYYFGVYSQGGTSRDEYTQKLFLCDEAGNLLYENTMLKTSIVDDVIGESEEDKLIYTVKRASRHVFLPAVDKNGDIYYGIIDYRKKQIDIMKRQFYGFLPYPSAPALENEIDREQGFIIEAAKGQCGSGGKDDAFLPKIFYAEPGRDLREFGVKDLTIKGCLAKIAMSNDESLLKTLSRPHRGLPVEVKSIQDSLARLITSRCLYSVALGMGKNNASVIIRYNPGDAVISARVLRVTKTFEVLVRVDLEDRAEILVFSTDGQFLNRFRFNNENYEIRNDLIAVSDDRKIYEKDYEIGQGAYRYLEWKLVTSEAR
jgi:hypothetical protein